MVKMYKTWGTIVLLVGLWACSTKVNDATQNYKGTIGTNMAVQMQLERKGDSLSGFYFYETVKTPIPLIGKHLPNNQFVLEEYNNNTLTGTFEGTWADANLTGNWRSPDGKRSYPFELKLTDTIALSPPKQTIQGLTFKELVYSYKDPKGTCELSAKVPLITGGVDPVVQKRINQTFNELFTKYKKSAESEKDFLCTENIHITTNINILDYTIINNDGQYFEVGFTHNFFNGGAHGMTVWDVRHFRLSDGKALLLKDVLKDGYKDVLKPILGKMIAERMGLYDNAELLTDSTNFSIDAEGLSILFQQNEVVPYVQNSDFLIPYSQIQDLIRPNTPFDKYVTKR